MKKLLLLSAIVAGCLSGQTVTVTASHLADSSQNPITGTIYFQPCDASGNAIGFALTGKGQTAFTAVTAPVSNGAFSLQIADTTQTHPANVCYRVWATNTLGQVVVGSKYQGQASGYQCVQVQPSWCASGTPLPTCAAAYKGTTAVVSDATTPSYMGTYTSGGLITAPVVCSYNGSSYSWLTY